MGTPALYTMNFRRSITSWDEALPVGNGKLGTLIYGRGPVFLSVDRVDLWDNRANPLTKKKAYCWNNLVRLSTSEDPADWEERDRTFEKINSTPNPSKLTAGRILVDFGKESDHIRSHLDVKKGIAKVTVDEESSVEVFLSATRYVGAMKITGNAELSLHIPEYLSKDGKDGLGYPRAEVFHSGDFLYYIQKTLTDYFFGILCYIRKTETGKECWYTIFSSTDRDDLEKTKENLKKICDEGYDKILKEHISYWRKYWNKSCVVTGDRNIDKNYILCQYLFASCSRKGFSPAPLQGVWTADNDQLPPWRGDYHFDTNVQFTYSSYLRSNHLDEGSAILDYLWDRRKTYEKYTKKFYGVKGILLPSCSTYDGSPIGGWAQYSCSPTMTIWMMQVFDQQYRYTESMTFLKRRAYPMFLGTASAVASLLAEKNGKLYLPLSSSPEIHDNAKQAYLEPNSNFDTCLLIYLFRTMAEYCDILGLDGTKWKDILSKIEPFAFNENGIFMLDRKETLQESHRHFSHLMSLYPIHLYPYAGNEELYHRNLDELERLGTSLWVGFSFVWASNLYSLEKDPVRAYKYLNQYMDGFLSKNGFHLNGDYKRIGYCRFHYRPFTLEANFAFCDAVHQMVLQDADGILELFPSVPKEMNGVSFKGLLSRGNLVISAAMKDQQLEKLIIRAPFAKTVRVSFGKTVKNISLEKGINVISPEIFR